MKYFIFTWNHSYYNNWHNSYEIIDHFRVPLCFKTSLNAKPFLSKWLCMKMKLHTELILPWKVSHLFWNKGPRGLGNDLFISNNSFFTLIPVKLFQKLKTKNLTSMNYLWLTAVVSDEVTKWRTDGLTDWRTDGLTDWLTEWLTDWLTYTSRQSVFL